MYVLEALPKIGGRKRKQWTLKAYTKEERNLCLLVPLPVLPCL